MSEIGNFIKKLRLEGGMNITEMAAKTGISRPYLSQIESGKRRPSNDLLFQLSKTSGISYSTLLHVAGDDEQSRAVLQAEIKYDELVGHIERLQKDDSLSSFVRALREAFNYSVHEVAEITDLPISVIKALESSNLEELNKVLTEEVLYKLSKCYEEDLFNVFYALSERAGFVEQPGFNHIAMLRDSSNLIESLQSTKETAANRNREKINLDKILSSDKETYFKKILLTNEDKKVLHDIIELLISYKSSNSN